MFLTGFCSFCVLLHFPLLINMLFLCIFFDAISSIKDEVLSVNLLVNVLVFGDFNIPHEDWLIHSGGTDRSDELSYNFLSQ